MSGVLLAALNSLVTPETRAMLSCGEAGSSSSASSFAAAASAAAASVPLPKTITVPVARALPPLVAEMRLALPSSTVEALVAEVARSFDLSGAAWNDDDRNGNDDEGNESKNLSPLSDAQWQVILLVLLKALSLERVPALRPAFEEREGIARLSASLRGLGCTLEAFGALLDVAVVADD